MSYSKVVTEESLRNILNEVLPIKSSNFAIENVSESFSIAANGAYTFNKSVTKSGYYPLGIVGIGFGGNNSGYAVPRSFELTNVADGSCNVVSYITNRGNVTGTWTATFKVLWVHN